MAPPHTACGAHRRARSLHVSMALPPPPLSLCIPGGTRHVTRVSFGWTGRLLGFKTVDGVSDRLAWRLGAVSEMVPTTWGSSRGHALWRPQDRALCWGTPIPTPHGQLPQTWARQAPQPSPTEVVAGQTSLRSDKRPCVHADGQKPWAWSLGRSASGNLAGRCARQSSRGVGPARFGRRSPAFSAGALLTPRALCAQPVLACGPAPCAPCAPPARKHIAADVLVRALLHDNGDFLCPLPNSTPPRVSPDRWGAACCVGDRDSPLAQPRSPSFRNEIPASSGTCPPSGPTWLALRSPHPGRLELQGVRQPPTQTPGKLPPGPPGCTGQSRDVPGTSPAPRSMHA